MSGQLEQGICKDDQYERSGKSPVPSATCVLIYKTGPCTDHSIPLRPMSLWTYIGLPRCWDCGETLTCQQGHKHLRNHSLNSSDGRDSNDSGLREPSIAYYAEFNKKHCIDHGVNAHIKVDSERRSTSCALHVEPEHMTTEERQASRHLKLDRITSLSSDSMLESQRSWP